MREARGYHAMQPGMHFQRVRDAVFAAQRRVSRARPLVGAVGALPQRPDRAAELRYANDSAAQLLAVRAMAVRGKYVAMGEGDGAHFGSSFRRVQYATRGR